MEKNEPLIKKKNPVTYKGLTTEELEALTQVKMPLKRRVSKTWAAMVKYKGQATVNDPTLLV